MGLFDRFKKHSDPDELEHSPLPDMTPLPPPPEFNPPSFAPSPEPPQQYPSQHPQNFDHPIATIVPAKSDYDKDFQILFSKLDTITAELDSIKQRVMHIERIADQSQGKEKRYGW
jgi:hypothetical protein